MNDLTITLIQTELFWEDIPSNLSMFDQKIDRITDETDLIILPEMFNTGFSNKAHLLAETMTGSSTEWMKQKSRQKQVDITGSLIIRENGKYYNRLIWAKPDGRFFIYDKKHLFQMSGEDKIFSPGEKNILVEQVGWKIRPFICYDLRFPVWTRNIENQFDVAIFVANWPEMRSSHWKLLLQARAVENQCFIIGVNRVGTDGNGHPFSGDSSVIDPRGNILFQLKNEAAIHTTTLSYAVLKEYRESFPAWMDADGDIILHSDQK